MSLDFQYVFRRWFRALASVALAGFPAASAEPVITELMAANVSVLADEDGNYSDWIELHNPGAQPVELAGWHLTDTRSNLTRWQFPEVTLPAGGYLVVFASGKDRRDPQAPLHTNFSLDADGEYLALVPANGAAPAFEYFPAYPAQEPDHSFGILSLAATQTGNLAQPSPGGPNGGGTGALAARVAFSPPAGPFTGPLTVALAGAGGDERIRYTIATEAAAAAEVTADSPEYTGPIVLNRPAVIRAAVFSTDGTARGATAAARYLPLGADAAAFSSHLPVLVLDLAGGEAGAEPADLPSWLFGYDTAGSERLVFAGEPAFAAPLIARVRGNSSATFPKKSFNLKLRDDHGAGAERALLDLPPHEKWALVGSWSFDVNFINNAFMYALSNRIGRWAPRTRFAEVFVKSGNGPLAASDYAGVYALTDRVESGPERVDVPSLASRDVAGDALTGGYILKIDVPNADETGWTTRHGVAANGISAVLLVEPGSTDVQPAQLAYIRDYVQNMEDALHADRAGGFRQRTYLDFIDRDAWVDHHLLNVLASNPDALIRSAYFTKDRGGKLAAGPLWDFDRALGGFWDLRSNVLATWSGENAEADVWRSGWWGVLAEDPEFRQDWIDRWQSLRRTHLATSALHTLAEDLAKSIGPAAARDAARWPDNASPLGSYPAQIDYLKRWLALRTDWIDAQFVAAPTVEPVGANLVFKAPPGAVLVYTNEGADPRLLGGAVAPDARMAGTTLTVAASANVHVRSYDAAQKDRFPGSPWSAAIGGDGATPLTPKARLINISARATAAGGEGALIAGVVVADTAAKPFLTRAAGPALASFGASGVLPEPQLSVFNAAGVEILRNTGWSNDPAAADLPAIGRAVGAFPFTPGSADSALVPTLGGGAFTVQVSGGAIQSGLALAEVYELNRIGRIVNLSTRAPVGSGDAVLIGGFVVDGPAHKRLLLRGIGPTLSAFGVHDALADPVLTVYRGPTPIATNDRWWEGDAARITAAAQVVGAFPLAGASEDAALLLTLPPGAYTVELKGGDGGEGVGLLEIYDVQ